MPDRRLHCFVDRLLFGRCFSEVHRYKDRASRHLGPRHRVVGHSPVDNLRFEGLEFKSAIWHDILDHDRRLTELFRRLYRIERLIRMIKDEG